MEQADRLAEKAAEDPAVIRDMVLVGASAGGVEALSRLLSQLPGTFAAAVFVVQHQRHLTTNGLVTVLQRSSVLPVRWAMDQDPIVTGMVRVAPAGLHMMFDGDAVILSPGPRENHARPSIDRLFRSAAACHGPRAIGVVLSGALDDGAAGLAALKRCGALAIVQDPSDARFPYMPQSALVAVQPDRILPLDRIGAALVELVGQPAPPVTAPSEVRLEAKLDQSSPADPAFLSQFWPATKLMCPECGGPMWAVDAERTPRFRCYLGHAMTAEVLLAEQSDNLERALWAAVRILQERAATLETLGRESQQSGLLGAHTSFSNQSQDARDHADSLRRFLLEVQRRSALSQEE